MTKNFHEISINQSFNLVASVSKSQTDKLAAYLFDASFANFTHKPMETNTMMEEFSILTSIRAIPELLSIIDSI